MSGLSRKQIESREAAAHKAEQSERRRAAAQRQSEMERRDAAVRQRAFQIEERRRAAAREADELQTDFLMAAGRLAAGDATEEEVLHARQAREEARARADVWATAAGAIGSDPAIIGRR
jgi:hypothetical protein